MRRAVAAFEAGLTPDELDQLSTLSDAIGDAATRKHDAIDRTVAAVDRQLDEAAMRARVRQRLDRDAVTIDTRLLDFGGARSMSPFDRIWKGLKSVIQLEGDVARLTAKVEALDVRERETRERLIYLEGVIAVAHERTASALARLEDVRG